jgi:hypothetical protein
VDRVRSAGGLGRELSADGRGELRVREVQLDGGQHALQAARVGPQDLFGAEGVRQLDQLQPVAVIGAGGRLDVVKERVVEGVTGAGRDLGQPHPVGLLTRHRLEPGGGLADPVRHLGRLSG